MPWIRRRYDSGASGSAQPLTKDDEQSSKKPRESDASASKQHPALTSTGWQITDTRYVVVDPSMHRSDPESEHSEQSSDEIPMQDEGHVSDLEDTDNAHIPKVSTTTWRTGKKKLCKADLKGPAFNLVDLVNPKGHQILRNIYELLPLGGPPVQLKAARYLDFGLEELVQVTIQPQFFFNKDLDYLLTGDKERNIALSISKLKAARYLDFGLEELVQVTIQPQFFFNKDLDYLLTGDKERNIALSISKLKAARYLDFGLEELVPSLWVESDRDYDISAAYGITHWWFRIKEFYINKHSEPSDREVV
ncbi:hypothetical protein Tco_0862835 [Tanacetum coccineum]